MRQGATTADTLVLPFLRGARLRRDGPRPITTAGETMAGRRCAGFDLGSGSYGFEVLFGEG